MTSTLLPVNPEVAAILTEIAPVALALKDISEFPQPGLIRHSLDAVPAAVVAAENFNNAKDA